MRRYWVFISILLCFVLLTTAGLSATDEGGRPVFEKGDAIYREGSKRGSFLFGHTGLYYQYPGYICDPGNLIVHSIIESKNEEPGVKYESFSNFYYATEFWGVRTSNILDYQKRRQIIHAAKDQIGCAFNLFFSAYKNPATSPGAADGSFRCDGLVEYCYEQAGIDIVPNDNWLTLNPRKQMNRLHERTNEEIAALVPEVEIKAPSEQDEIITGEYALVAFASDGEKGSGITKVEFWQGEPDDTPDVSPGTLLEMDNHDEVLGGDYAYPWNAAAKNPVGTPEFPDDYYPIFAKAFDQAGNTKVSDGARVIVNNIPPIIINESPTGQISETKPTIFANILSEDGIVPVDSSSIIVTLDNVPVAYSVHSYDNGCYVILYFIPPSDLNAGQHTVTVDAKDTSGLAAEQKAWSFTIAAITGGDWRYVLNLLNQKRADVEKDPVNVPQPEDIYMEGVLTIKEATVDILEDYGFTGLADALNCAGYTQTTWSEGFDCKSEIMNILNLMTIITSGLNVKGVTRHIVYFKLWYTCTPEEDSCDLNYFNSRDPSRECSGITIESPTSRYGNWSNGGAHYLFKKYYTWNWAIKHIVGNTASELHIRPIEEARPGFKAGKLISTTFSGPLDQYPYTIIYALMSSSPICTYHCCDNGTGEVEHGTMISLDWLKSHIPNDIIKTGGNIYFELPSNSIRFLFPHSAYAVMSSQIAGHYCTP